MSKVYAVIITYNGIKWIEKCLLSLCTSRTPLHIVVVDNDSNDGTQDIINSNFPNVDFIQLNENIGFGKANNIGIKKALERGADFIFLLNQDAYLYKGSLDSAISILVENNNIGIVSPIHFAGDGKNLDFAFYNYIHPSETPFLVGDFLDKSVLKKYYETEFVNAAAWIIRANLFKDLGAFHPIFDHYGEDNEFIIRIKKNNFIICIDPTLSIIHDRPQYRKDNIFFERYRSLERSILLTSFRGKSVTHAYVFQKYLKLFLVYLFNFNIKGAYLTFKFFLKTIKSIRIINNDKRSA